MTEKKRESRIVREKIKRLSWIVTNFLEAQELCPAKIMKDLFGNFYGYESNLEFSSDKSYVELIYWELIEYWIRFKNKVCNENQYKKRYYTQPVKFGEGDPFIGSNIIFSKRSNYKNNMGLDFTDGTIKHYLPEHSISVLKKMTSGIRVDYFRVCNNEKCEAFFVATDPRKRYCKNKCASAAYQRRLVRDDSLRHKYLKKKKNQQDKRRI